MPTTNEKLLYVQRIQPLPGGRHLLLYAEEGNDVPLVLAINIESGESKVVFEGGYAPTYLSTGHLLVAQKGVLLAMPFDASTLERGKATPVLSGLLTDSNNTLASYFVSETGTLAYLTGVEPQASETFLVRIRPGDEPERLHPNPIPANFGAGLRVSPDGRRVAYQAGRNLFLFDLDRGQIDRQLTRLTRGAFPRWSSSGQIAYMSNDRPEGWVLAAQSSEEGASERILVPGASTKYAGSWSPDGSTLLYTSLSPETQSDIWTINVDDKADPELFRATLADEKWPTISPDGRWVAFVSDELHGWIWVASYPDGSNVRRVTTGGAVAPRFGPQGKRLFFLRGDKVMVTDILDRATFETSQPTLFVEGIDKDLFGHSWDLAPDGESVIALEARPPQELHVVLNWLEELKRLVPIE